MTMAMMVIRMRRLRRKREEAAEEEEAGEEAEEERRRRREGGGSRTATKMWTCRLGRMRRSRQTWVGQRLRQTSSQPPSRARPIASVQNH